MDYTRLSHLKPGQIETRYNLHLTLHIWLSSAISYNLRYTKFNVQFSCTLGWSSKCSNQCMVKMKKANALVSA